MIENKNEDITDLFELIGTYQYENMVKAQLLSIAMKNKDY